MSQNGDDNINEDAAFSGKELQKAFGSVARLIGRASTESILFQLKTEFGISIDRDSNDSYTLAKLRAAMQDMFGQDGSELFMQRIKKELKGQLDSNDDSDL